MSIADAPLWAQTPTAEIIREVPSTGHPEDGLRVIMWHHEGQTYFDIDPGVRPAIDVATARQMWTVLGDLLALEATSPADLQVTASPWEVDIDGEKSRRKTTPKVATGAVTSDGRPLYVHVELFDTVDSPTRPNRRDHPEIVLRDQLGHGIELADIASTDAARALAFALLRAATVVDHTAGGTL